MTQALIVRDDAKLSIAFTETAITLNNAALEQAALIGKVDGAFSQQQAVEAQKELTNVVNLVEKARKAAKEPVLDFGRAIDASARSFIAEAQEEQLRISQLIADFQQLEQARVRGAEQARLAEQRRLEMEKRAEEDRIRREAEIERQKLEAIEREAAKAISEAKNKAAKEAAESLAREVERQRALSEAKSHDQLDKINQRHCEEVAALPVAAPIRAEGQRVREVWEIVVNDIWTLARAHPMCVKVEARLSEIQNLLDAGVKVAGVTAKRQIKAGVMGGRTIKAIEV